MFENLNEEKLQELYRDIFEDESLENEKEFVKAAFDKIPAYRMVKKDYGHSAAIEEDLPTAEAQLLTNSGKYIKLWEMAKDLFVDLCKGGLIDAVVGTGSLTIGLAVTVLDFLRRWGEYCEPLEEEEKEFCKYLITTAYTHKDFIQLNKGFELDYYIEYYCYLKIEAGYPEDKKEELKQKIQGYANKLKEKKILVQKEKEKGTNRYIIKY